MIRAKTLMSALAATALVAACSSDDDKASTPTPTPPVAQAPKNILFFLGDGMGITTLTAARIYKVGEDGDLTIDTLPETAFVHTYSNDAQVTDSAPSMAAYMTGVKMNNEVISMSADTKATDANGKPYHASYDATCPAGNGTPVETLLELMKAKGYGTGVVTTTRITHATPAATYSHVCHRDAENTIAAALVPGGAGFNARLNDGVDVFFGGGTDYFLPGKRRQAQRQAQSHRRDQDQVRLRSESRRFRRAAHRRPQDRRPLHQEPHGLRPGPRPGQGAQPGGHDRQGDRRAGRQEQGFFLMVEGGRIDHALHATNARRALQDTVAFDDSIKLALDKMRKVDPDLKNTLIVVTADHDHTLQMNGYAARTGKTEPGKPGVLGLVKNYVGPAVPTKDVDGNPYTIIGFGNGPKRLATRGPIDDTALEDKNYLQEAVIPMDPASDSETHGGADVFLGAIGLNADKFSGVITNTDVFGLIRKAVNL